MVEFFGTWTYDEYGGSKTLSVEVIQSQEQPALFDVDRGDAIVGDQYKLPDQPTSFHNATGVSMAETALRYSAPGSVVTLDAELFGREENMAEFRNDAFELYPLDGNNMPIEVRLSEWLDTDSLAFSQMCAAVMYAYVQKYHGVS